jgi:hypothetical protein
MPPALEILFFFGYRRELKERFEKGVEQEILKFRKQGNGLSSKAGARFSNTPCPTNCASHETMWMPPAQ